MDQPKVGLGTRAFLLLLGLAAVVVPLITSDTETDRSTALGAFAISGVVGLIGGALIAKVGTRSKRTSSVAGGTLGVAGVGIATLASPAVVGATFGGLGGLLIGFALLYRASS